MVGLCLKILPAVRVSAVKCHIRVIMIYPKNASAKKRRPCDITEIHSPRVIIIFLNRLIT